jgi:heat-inducible transcriptional repressor
MVLSARRKTILKAIVDDYVAEAAPVASNAIAHNYSLGVSPATIRNDMAFLEEQGYIARPHHSAGSIPTDKAYRYYVESISGDVELSLAEEYLVNDLFRKAREEIEQGLKLAAAWLAYLVNNIALVSPVRIHQHRLKHLDLVALRDFAALLILVLCQAQVRKQVLSFDKSIGQDELTKLANRLNAAYSGMTSSEILASETGLCPEEEQVTKCLVDIIAAEDKLEYGKPYLEGLRLMLSQPEFTSSPRILNILGVLEEGDWFRNLSCQKMCEGETKVIIGEENPEEALQGLSLVIGHYGMPEKASGLVGVLGPKRMDYAKAICSVNRFSSLLSKSLAEYV